MLNLVMLMLDGLIVGAIAVMLRPKNAPRELSRTLAISVLGALVGGIFGGLIGARAQVIAAIAGAVLLVGAWHGSRRRSAAA